MRSALETAGRPAGQVRQVSSARTFSSPRCRQPPVPICNALVPEDATACSECGYHFAPATRAFADEGRSGRQAQRLPEPGLRDPESPRRTALPALQHAAAGGLGQLIAGKYRIDQPLADRRLRRGLPGDGHGHRPAGRGQGDDRRRPARSSASAALSSAARRRSFGDLQHVPIVPRLYDFIEDGSAAYLVLEFIPGDNLLNAARQAGATAVPGPAGGRLGGEDLRGPGPHAPAYAAAGSPRHEAGEHHAPAGRGDDPADRLRDGPRHAATGRRNAGWPRPRCTPKGTPRRSRSSASRSRGATCSPWPARCTTWPPARPRRGSSPGRTADRRLAAYPADERWFYELIAINLSEDANDRYMTARDVKGDLERGAVTREISCANCGTATPARSRTVGAVRTRWPRPAWRATSAIDRASSGAGFA